MNNISPELKGLKKTEIYVVIAYRWGNSENHSYTVGIFDDKTKAIDCANSHTQYRGGKYACSVEMCIMNEFDNDADNYSVEIYKTSSAKSN